MSSFRARLTGTFVALVLLATALVLLVSWWLIGRHLERTLPAGVADAILAQLGGQYALAAVGTGLLALGAGWLAAGRLLEPVRAVADTARRVAGADPRARARLEGPRDELHELGAAVDAMLDQVQDAAARQQRFVANASHELRTPLTVIRAEAEVALDDPDASDAELREALRAVLTTSDRTEALLDGLLALATADGAGSGGGRAARRDERVELAAVARRAMAATGGPWLGADLRPAAVRGDDVLLERLVGNLVENAVRHGRDPRVEVRTEGDEAVVRVANAGDPIAAPDLARLAQPFERLHRSRARGTGLGLAIVDAIAKSHGGALRLSAPPAGGLRAEVRFPALPA